jgi:hypothetical protein
MDFLGIKQKAQKRTNRLGLCANPKLEISSYHNLIIAKKKTFEKSFL